MSKRNLRTVSIRMAQDAIEYLNSSFDESGANSKGEFIVQLLDKYNSAPSEPEVKTVTIEKPLQANELLIKLTPAQMFAIKGHILSTPDFAEKQNSIIDKLKGNAPLMYFGHLFDPELQKLWVRNIPIRKTMSEEEKETVVRHNMAAFLTNMFLSHLIEGNLGDSKINAKILKAFIQKSNMPAKENSNPK
ncbi:hypothetical protein SAMN05444274_10695 [Mariniphaga anaerophila]|uniref:Uncharacterized protein n=1 Tax=Mariniphaga anaerophila TaxID=1484053 RepID=A0A1M5CF72_9BACT|nr:hypothetical protein [Mariniphaga anaerophila]SHF53326.1 hypothetical protein SAMN05444274_10695 [Mariniphaga anaerophila]